MADRKPNKAEFSPTANYQWQSTDKFVLTGGEIDLLNKALNAQTQELPQYQKFLWLREALLTMTNVLKEAYDQGIIKEIGVPQSEQLPLPKAELTEMKAVPVNGIEDEAHTEQELG